MIGLSVQHPHWSNVARWSLLQLSLSLELISPALQGMTLHTHLLSLDQGIVALRFAQPPPIAVTGEQAIRLQREGISWALAVLRWACRSAGGGGGLILQRTAPPNHSGQLTEHEPSANSSSLP